MVQDITKEKIAKILDTGAKVILTTKGIDDLCLKYFVEAGAMAVRRVKKVPSFPFCPSQGTLSILFRALSIRRT